MTIQSLTRRRVVTVTPETPIDETARKMRDAGVGSTVVVEDDRPVGIVTDRDLALDVVGTGTDPRETTAGDVMVRKLVTVATDANVLDALDRLLAAKVRRLPVVRDDGTLAGIVTMDDFLVLLAAEFRNLAAVVEAESPPY
ncbi:CBS domain-containing protein [Haloarcula nitratireducens]|uniref:CBS domain-containing protein n=1 Tax=Haloarcula nitratireducens TaxID=2487749 RepID=A0AAW4PEJ3_9EURY|nr:CBS domain-containing protein [Halomicroarcula nitratireducens]MBX0296249.1 CBS domain-containing protein [Halomicroarcula nitratireducens]